jgi:GT2 family glycosyltransferase
MLKNIIKTNHMESNKENPQISIIILNYNAGDLLIDCVDSIEKSNYKNLEIILVDNISKDNSHKKCKEKFPKIKLIENLENLGYCEGNNVGIRMAKGEYVVILNPDTVVDPNWISGLLSAFLENGDGIYQPKFLATTDHSMLLSTGNMIHLFGFGYSRSKGDIDKGEFEKFEKIDFAAGTCIFTSKKILDKIGLFESFLFAFHDDFELCWRGALMGINSFYVPSSTVYHPIEGYSFGWSPLKFKLLERNRKYCLLTLYSRSTFFKMIPGLLLIDIAVFLFYLSKGMGRIKISADLEILKNFKKINKKYQQNQKIRKISDRELLVQFKNEVIVPNWVIKDKTNILFNKFLLVISKITRMFLGV